MVKLYACTLAEEGYKTDVAKKHLQSDSITIKEVL